MKKIIIFILSLFVSVSLFACSKKQENKLEFTVKDTDTAYLGDIYEISDVFAKDSNGKEYLASFSVKANDNDVVVTNNQFTIEILADYIITYTVNFEGKDEVRTTTINVLDNIGPSIKVEDFNDNVKINDTFVIPQVSTYDNSNKNVIIKTNAYFKEETTEVTYLDEAKNSFKCEKSGYYRVVITATDESNNSTTKELIINVRDKFEVESFDNEKFVSGIGNFGTPNGAMIEYNSNKQFVLQGSGSLKFIAPESHGVGSCPEITIEKPAITDITTFHSFSFYVYNNNSKQSRINVSNRNEGWFVLEPYQWTKVEITKDMFDTVLPGFDFSNNPCAGKNDLTGLRLYFDKTQEGEMSFYFDDMRVNDKDNNIALDEFNNADIKNVGEEITVSIPQRENLTVSLVNKNTGERKTLSADNNKLLLDKAGAFYIEYLVTDYNDNIGVYYDEFAVVETVIKGALTIEDFENNPELLIKHSSKVKSQVTNDPKYVLDGKQALEISINGDDGYPYFALPKNVLSSYVDKFDFVTLRLFNAGNKEHNMSINFIEMGVLKPGLNEIKITNDMFKQLLDNDKPANQADPGIYKEGYLTFFVFNVDAQNEPFNIYLDNFTGSFGDISAKDNQEVDFNFLFKDYTVSNLVVKLNETVIETVDNKFIPTTPGIYDVTLTLGGTNYKDETISFKLEVINTKKPVIELTNFNKFGNSTDPYKLPNVVALDFNNQVLEAKIQLFNGLEEITLNGDTVLLKNGKYRLVVSAVDKFNNETVVEEIITIKNKGEVEDFEDFDAVKENISVVEGTIQHNTNPEFVLNGNASIKVVGEVGIPGITLNLNDVRGSLGDNKYLEINFYLNGNKPHNIEIKDSKNCLRAYYDLAPKKWHTVYVETSAIDELISKGETVLSILTTNFGLVDWPFEFYFDNFRGTNKTTDLIYDFEVREELNNVKVGNARLDLCNAGPLVNTGASALKLDASSPEWGYPSVSFNLNDIVTKLGLNENLEFVFYMNGNNAHNTLIKFDNTDYKLQEYQAKTWNKVVIPTKVLKEQLAAGVKDLTFMIFNPGGEACREEFFEIYLDSFKGSFNDISLALGKTLDLNTYYETAVSNLDIKLNGESISVVDNKFIPTKPGLYDLNFNLGDLKVNIKVNVIDESKPEIIVNNFVSTSTVGTLYDLPEIIVNDNQAETIIPTITVTYNDLEVEILNNQIKLDNIGTYTITIKAIDSNLNETVKVLTLNVRGKGLVEDFENFNDTKGNYSAQEAELFLNEDKNYCLDGTKSLKMNGLGGYPSVNFNVKELLKNITDETYIKVNLLMKGNKTHTFEVKRDNQGFDAYYNARPNEWLSVYVKTSDILNNNQLNFTFINTDGSNHLELPFEVYFDKFEAVSEIKGNSLIDFENESDLNLFKVDQGELLICKDGNLSTSGLKSLKLNATSPAWGYPNISLDLANLIQMMGNNDLFSFDFKLNGQKSHGVLVKFGETDYKVVNYSAQVWNTMNFDKALLEEKLAAGNKDIKVMIFNPGGDPSREEFFEIFFDNFRASTKSTDLLFGFENQNDLNAFSGVEASVSIENSHAFGQNSMNSLKLNGTGGYPTLEINLKTVVDNLKDNSLDFSFYMAGNKAHNYQIFIDNDEVLTKYDQASKVWHNVSIDSELLKTKLAEGKTKIRVVFVNSDGVSHLELPFEVYFDNFR